MRIGIALYSFYHPAYVGGVQSYVHSLLKNLLNLGTGDRYVLLVRREAYQHFEDLLKSWNIDHAPVEFITVPFDAEAPHPLLRAANVRSFLNGLSLDVLHFPIHWMDPVGVDVPTVLSPHDIQHFHLPHLFSHDELTFRQHVTYASCKSATTIVTQSQFIKNDLIQQFNLHPEKIHIVQVAADDIFHEPVSRLQLELVRSEYRLPDRFLYYPAHLWPHKNHVRLIRVLASMRRHDHLEIPLVLTGSRQTGYDAVAQEITEHDLSRQVLFLGAVPLERLPALYTLSHGAIAPSLYEGSSFPVLEAFATGTAMIASNIPPVQELIADEDFLFDPRNEGQMAEKIRRLWVDNVFCEKAKGYSLSQRGKYSWKEVAAKMMNVYREAALASSPHHHDKATMEKALNARGEVIDDLRGRLTETEKAFEACERDRIAKEQVIQELKETSMHRLEALEVVNAAAQERLEKLLKALSVLETERERVRSLETDLEHVSAVLAEQEEKTRGLIQALGAIRSDWGYRASAWFRTTFRGR